MKEKTPRSRGGEGEGKKKERRKGTGKKYIFLISSPSLAKSILPASRLADNEDSDGESDANFPPPVCFFIR